MSNWLIGLGLTFGFGLVMAFYLDFTLENFLGFSTMFCSFSVYMELLPVWILVFLLIGLFLIVIFNNTRNLGGIR